MSHDPRRHFPLRHKYDKLGPAARRLAHNPRYARLIALLPVERFARLQTEAATFWEVYTYVADRRAETGLLDDGLKATAARELGFPDDTNPPERPSSRIRRWQMRLALDMLAAIAFEMYCGRDGTGTTPPIDEVRATEGENLDSFLGRALGRFAASGAYRNLNNQPIADSDGTRLDADWQCLKAMDSHGLKYFVFSETEEVVRFNDVTTRAFLAAYWASRWVCDEDRRKMRGWIPDPIRETNDVYVEFWRMVAEMPDAAEPPVKAFDPERWEALLAPCYDGTLVDEEGLPIRSTELIYRTWERMKDTEAGRLFRDEFRRLRESDNAPEVSRQFEDQFLLLCRGERGPEDTGHFMMGASADDDPGRDFWGGVQENPEHPVRLTDYLLAATCVTNQQYELFDARHRSSRVFTGDGLNVDDHPVVAVSWYDAWCFAMWLGVLTINGEEYQVELPTEAQWEYACQCGRSTPFTWNGERDGNRIESKYCNFAGGHSWQKPGAFAPGTGTSRRRTVGVHEFEPNPWGFRQMHGNVLEWCADWFGRDYYRDSPEHDPTGPVQAISRVTRGGSWISRGGECRSACRSGDPPYKRYGGIGFRLAAVPQSRASQE